MAESNKNELDILNVIKSSNNSKNVEKWASEASSQFYKIEIEKLKIKIENQAKERARIEEGIKDITPTVEFLEQHLKTLNEAFQVNQESLLNQRMYLKCVEKSAQENEEEADNILKKFSEHVDKTRRNLEETTPSYKILKEKKDELRRINFNIRMLQFKIKERQRIDRMKREIHQKIFYNECVKLAENWLKQQKYDESVRKLEALTKEEAELTRELMDLSLKEERKNSNVDIRTLPGSSKDDKKKMAPPPLSEFSESLNDIFTKQSFAPFQPGKLDLNSIHNSNYLANNQNVPIPAKIQILEIKTIKEADKATAVEKPTIAEKKKAIDLKYQELFRNINFDRSASQEDATPRRAILREKSNNNQIKDKNPENMRDEEKSKALKMKLQQVAKNFSSRSASGKENNKTQSTILECQGQEQATESVVRPPTSSSFNVNENISSSQTHDLIQEIENLDSEECGNNVQQLKYDPEINDKNVPNQTKISITPMSKDRQLISRNNNNFGQVVNKSTDKETMKISLTQQTDVYVKDDDKNEIKTSVNEPKSSDNTATIINPDTKKHFTGFTTDVNSIYAAPGVSSGIQSNFFKAPKEKNNLFTWQKMDNHQDPTNNLNTLKDMKNYGEESTEKPILENFSKIEENRYNFGSLSQFNQSPAGSFNEEFPLSPINDDNNFMRTSNEQETGESFGNSGGFSFDLMNFKFKY